jgi:CRISPR-associated protein Cas2
MILKNVPTSLKGELSRWLIEPNAGTFLGNCSARVRDKLWEKALEKRKGGYILQVWSDHSVPQGYRYRSEGTSDRQMVDFEGIALVQRQPRCRKNSCTTDTEDQP